MKIVAYYRVSTKAQGASGLGLEAQQNAVQAFSGASGATIIQSYTEVESGTKNTRPQLEAAMHHAQITGATLVIAKLDRLSRNAAFLLNLKESGVQFVAADMPTANALTVGIMALVAQQEAIAISERTSAGLQAAKRRGVVLGNPNGADALRRANKGNTDAIAAIKHTADAAAHKLASTITAIRSEGHTSLRQIADQLNARGIKTQRGGKWYASTVRNVEARLVEA
ncbi:recombinase family protein [Sulfitobacter geojensis]|uniref:recombinase family protein n=1 Tax=Sulfitobacter geojensis TaxID=1342299 RepID=UPI0007DA3CE1|nr:recombinase family protein [Sulfitobacter geojensis]OAN98065.1 resolvase [Sulfitobacter geojensis]